MKIAYKEKYLNALKQIEHHKLCADFWRDQAGLNKTKYIITFVVLVILAAILWFML